GNFSRVDHSDIAKRARIDRNNHLLHARMGRHSYTGMNTVLMHANIGSFCAISWNVSIGAPDHDYRRIVQHSFLYNEHDQLRPAGESIAYDRFSEPLTIGHDVWIAAGVSIRRGVTIGDGAVVGANSVVTKNVPPYTVVTGAPARPVKTRFNPEIIDLLLQLRWWEWEDEKIREHYDLLSSQPDLLRLKALLALP
ncbi:MAG TPA: CatB-related O-acetyltransferase, partial [Burkholderiales bacterium]|nr:CatB-related O-acetyltransferase [Burkholderiales bacterium]